MRASTEFLVQIITRLVLDREGQTFEYRADLPEGLELSIEDDREAGCIRLSVKQEEAA